MTMFAKY